MPRALFEELLPEPGPTARWRALPVSLALHGMAALGVAALVGQPVASAQPEPRRTPLTWAPAAGAAPTLVPVAPRQRRSSIVRRAAAAAVAPAPLPPEPASLEPLPTGAFDPTPPACLTGCGDGDPSGAVAGSGGAAPGDGTGDAVTRGSPLPVGGNLHPPRKTRHVLPQYPELARRTGVGGAVVVQCVIDVDGRVAEARVVSGHPLLDDAALSAVRQWRYEPTRLNGIPVTVLLTVTVTFVVAR